MARTTRKQAVSDLLALYSPEVRSLALATRTFLLDLIPGAMELVDTKSRVIGYGFGTDIFIGQRDNAIRPLSRHRCIMPSDR